MICCASTSASEMREVEFGFREGDVGFRGLKRRVREEERGRVIDVKSGRWSVSKFGLRLWKVPNDFL